MINLIPYEGNEIRTIDINGEVWFSAQDVFHTLGLTWKGRNSLTQRSIPNDWFDMKESQTLGGNQLMIFISEQAVYMISFSANKNDKAMAFVRWVADLLKKLRIALESGVDNISDLRKMLDVNVQREYSKAINKKNIQDGGIQQVKDYNIKNCVGHTGMYPNEVKNMGKLMGLKSSKRTSAKEVLRNLKPEIACGMAFTDKLVTENNIDHDIAIDTSKNYATPLFQQLMQIGLSTDEIRELSGD